MRRAALVVALLGSLLTIFSVSAQETPLTISWPPPVYDLAGTVNIYGTVNPTGLQSYFLEAANYDLNAQSDSEAALWQPVSLPATQPVIEGIIGQWNTAVVPDGIYQLRVRAVLTSGESLFASVAPLRVANNLLRPSGGGEPSAPATQAPVVAAVPTATPAATALPLRENDLPLSVGGHVLNFNDATIAAMDQAGMTWVKWQTRLDLVDGATSLNIARDQIQRAHAQGFRVLLGLVGFSEQISDLGLEVYADIYADFARQVAEYGPDAIEIWNEPNLDREWPTGEIDPRNYVVLLSAAYEAIKAVNPEIVVISGALAPTGAEGAFGSARVWNDDRYYAGMATAGVAEYADCIGVHYNEGIIAPQQRGGDPRQPDYPTRYFVPMLERAAFPFRALDIPLCITELGYLSGEGFDTPIPSGFSWAAGNTVEEQATWLRDAIQIASEQTTLEVELMIIWNVDFEDFANDPMAGYAMIRPDGSCPACESISTLRGAGGG